MDIEISNRPVDKFIPHPILDDPTKMMRIIANPLYDRLTISRAAHVRKHTPAESARKSVQLNRLKSKSMVTPLKSLNNEEITITPLPTDNNPSRTKSASKRQNPPSFLLPTPSLINRISPRNIRLSAHSRTNSLHSSLIETDKKPVTENNNNNVRYITSRHGFEVQRYSSPNWLTIDLLTKDACETHEKTFREMIDKKEQNELSSRSIYTSEYYRQRWYDLLQSYKEGHLTHDQWAKQNYQLHCLKTFYIQAFEREQYRVDVHAEKQRKRRAQNVFNEWKEAKDEGNLERHRSHLHTANSQRTTDVASALSNPSFSLLPNHSTNRMSISSIVETDLEELPLFRRGHAPKKTKKPLKTSYMFDEQRWSLNAMLKRVVGLAEPLPPPPKINNRQHSPLTNVSNDSGFESGP